MAFRSKGLHFQVATNVLTHTRIIELGAGGEKQVLSGATWFVPPNVKATEDTRTAESERILY